MTDADYMAALCGMEHGHKFVPNGRGNWALFVYDIAREPTLHEGTDLRECVERYMRDTARAKTLPPPPGASVVRDFVCLRGKP